MKKLFLFIFCLSLSLNIFAATGKQNLSVEDKEVFRALQDEIKRNIKELKMDKFSKPYFITYKLIPYTKYFFGANQGVLTRSTKVSYPDYEVQVKVGSKKEDNSFFMPGVRVAQNLDSSFAFNYEGIRKFLWQITDGVYKNALAQLTEKQAYKKNKNITQEYDDFSFYPVQQIFETLTVPEVDQNYWQDIVKSTSAQGMARELEEFKTAVNITFMPAYFITSRGSKYLQDRYFITITFTAKGRLKDGFEFNLSKNLNYADFKDVPSQTELNKEALDFSNEVLALQKAKKAKAYIGPILLEGGQAAALMKVLQREISYTKPVYSNSQDISVEGAWADKLGLKVLSSGFDLIDEPLLKTFEGKKLAGYYQIDEEGVKAQKLQIIENGILKTLPYTASLTKNNKKSNGHARTYFMFSSAFAAPSNLILLPRKTIPSEDFLNTFKNFCAEQGLKACPVIKATDGKTFFGMLVDAKTGKQNAIYGELSSFDSRSLRDIKYASDKMQIYNQIINENGYSLITPDLILDNGEIIPTKKQAARKPLISKPN